MTTPAAPARLTDRKRAAILEAAVAEFRQAVATFYARRFGVQLDPDTEVLPLLGGKEGVAHTVQNASNMFSVFFTGREVRDYEGAKAQESFRYTAFFHSMLAQGVYLPPSSFESWFVSTAHDDQAVQRIADALPAAARAAAEATA